VQLEKTLYSQSAISKRLVRWFIGCSQAGSEILKDAIDEINIQDKDV
jgi:hypothetical protein